MKLPNGVGARVLISTLITASAATLAGCANNLADSTAPAMESAATPTLFREVSGVIPFGQERRRKWDSPVIADLDQDGLQDITVTEHGKDVLVYWNEGGSFSGPLTIGRGDLHGVTAADYDRDGVMDVIIAQGGGDGANPRRPIWLRVGKDRQILSKDLFDYFEKGRGRATKFIDPDGDGVLDLLLTGFPTPDQTEGANHLYRNVGNGKFEFVGHLPQAKWLGYRVSQTDFDSDNGSDIVFFGGENLRAVKSETGMAYDGNVQPIFGGLANTSDIHNAAEIDFDNDGDFDLFVTRAEPQFDLESYFDAANNTFAFLTFRKEFLHEVKVDGDLVIENLQRTYPHFDIHLGADRQKLPEVADRHAGRDLVIKPEDAAGWPDGETKAGLYIGYLGDGMWRIGGESRSRLAGVIHNVVSQPEIEPQIDLPARLFENRGGTYVDVTGAMGIDIADQTTSAAVGDFNNDGWSDLAVLRYGDMARINSHYLLLNRGGQGFDRVDNHGIVSTSLGTTGGSIEAWDYDSNGLVDLVFSSERGKWHLLENAFEETGNFAVVRIGNAPSGSALAAGAVLSVEACGNIYKRKVGAGSAAFSQSLNSELHVGLGECASIDRAQVRWTNGEVLPIAIELNGITEAGG